MCFPCWPWADIELKEDPRNKHVVKQEKDVLYHDPVSKTTVRLVGNTFPMATTGEQSFAPQVRDTRLGPNIHNYIPRADGAIVVGGIAYYPEGPKPAAIAIPTSLPVPVTTAAGQPTMVTPVSTPQIQPQYISPPAPIYPYYNPLAMHPPTAMPNFQQQPHYGHFGLTPNEVLAQNMVHAAGPEMSKRQEMKPADDDPHRFYWVRELDDSWTQRNRMTIDSGDIGDCRWFANNGEFYAIRLPMS